MKTAIRERALALGFDACQFTTARPPDSAAQFQRWLAAGRHGQMIYLERNARKRIAPSQVLSAARSIIALAVSYAAKEAGPISAARTSGQGTARPAGLLPLLHTDMEERAGERIPRTQNAPCAPEPPHAFSPSPPHTCGGEGRGEEDPARFMGRRLPAGSWNAESCSPGEEPAHAAESGLGMQAVVPNPNPNLNLNPLSPRLRLGLRANESGGPCVGEIARYARFSDYHDVVGARLKTLTEFVNRLGGGETRSLWYVDTGPLLERDLAQRAGLGFIGKHTNLISRRLGNWFFLAEIITTLELPPDGPEKNRCGSCRRCLEACPTAAITAPFQLDARRCISYLTIELKGAIPVELRPAVGNRIFGCDDCLAACPWNRFARAGSMMAEHRRAALEAPDLAELLALDEAGFQARFAGTPILRAKRRGFLRNVCVALGNTGDERALPALQRAASGPEPLIAEHALWAMERIKARREDGG